MIKPDKMDASYEAYQLREIISDRNDEIVSLQAELSTLRSTLDREREKSAELESTLAEVYEKVDKLEAENVQLWSDLKDYKGWYEDAVAELAGGEDDDLLFLFYQWYWELNRDNHNREELSKDYQDSERMDIPEEAWE